jgi:leader peptidase (prepilin peptidase)/N-methyltransferase
MISELVLNAAAGGVLGLLIGSFLNVVIHRLPLMMEQEWHAEGAQWAEEQRTRAPGSSCRRPSLLSR